MFSAFMVDAIVGKVNRRLIVTKKGDMFEVGNTDVLKKTDNPGDLRCC